MKMENMKIGTGNVVAPVITLGTYGMGGGTAWQDTTSDDEELVSLIRKAHEIGIRGIDTAPVYGLGRSEEIVGKAIKGHRDEYYLSTKCCMQWRDTQGEFIYERNGKNVYRCYTKASLIQDTEDCLRRLQTDYIDTMIIHRCPAEDQWGEIMEAMEELKSRGLIGAVGLSNTGHTPDPEAVVRAAEKYGRLDLLQESASLLSRHTMRNYLDICEARQMTFQTHTALEKGALAGKLINPARFKGDDRAGYRWFQPENIEKLNVLTKGLSEIADGYGCSVPALCLAWVRQQSSCVNLLFGARHIESILDTLKVLDLHISDADIRKMNELSDEANR